MRGYSTGPRPDGLRPDTVIGLQNTLIAASIAPHDVRLAVHVAQVPYVLVVRETTVVAAIRAQLEPPVFEPIPALLIGISSVACKQSHVVMLVLQRHVQRYTTIGYLGFRGDGGAMLRGRFVLQASTTLAVTGVAVLLFVGAGLFAAERGTIRDCGHPRFALSAWEDGDGDGQWAASETPLAGVAISIPDNYFFDLGGLTAADGFVPVGHQVFAPCDLEWRRAIAHPPAGFVGTTSTIAEGRATTYTFGFRRTR